MRRGMKTGVAAVLVFLLLQAAVPAQAGEILEPQNLYALSAVLLDGESGRVLYEKEGQVPRPMASTTKIMTCILVMGTLPIRQ